MFRASKGSGLKILFHSQSDVPSVNLHHIIKIGPELRQGIFDLRHAFLSLRHNVACVSQLSVFSRSLTADENHFSAAERASEFALNGREIIGISVAPRKEGIIHTAHGIALDFDKHSRIRQVRHGNCGDGWPRFLRQGSGNHREEFFLRYGSIIDVKAKQLHEILKLTVQLLQDSLKVFY